MNKNEDISEKLNEIGKEMLEEILFNAIKEKFPEDLLEHLYKKLASSWEDLSISFLKNHLSELLGYAFGYGIKQGIKYRDEELARKKLQEEFEKKKDNKMFI